eukprot:jgi/Ulvmu1/1886/UM012_0043.1
MATKGGAKGVPTLDDELLALQKALEKKSAVLFKVLIKKLKLKKEAMQALANVLIEAQMAHRYQGQHQLPVKIDEKLGATHEVLTLADERTFDKATVENLLAFFKDLTPAELNEVYLPPPARAVYLQNLALKMADSWTYTQATSLKYAPRLKRAAEVLARMVPGATFGKAWRPKPTAAIYSKLYHHRGQVPQGWLSDAIQGRINCESMETVQQVAAFFRGILEAQAAAADAAERPPLSEEPTGAEIQAYDLDGLTVLETGLPVDALATHCHGSMTPEDHEILQDCTLVVYRVKECACCAEVEELEAGEVMLVNLLLARPCARRSGFLWRVPEGDLVATMELQVATPAAFKVMKKGADAHDRAALLSRFPMLNKLQELAAGSEGKLVFPAVVKGVAKGGDGGAGAALMHMFRGIDLMHPAVDGAEAAAHAGRVPGDAEFEWHVRDRPAPGSRWFCMWEGLGGVVRVDAVGLRVAGKVPPGAQFSVLLSGELPGGEVVHLVEERLAALPVVKGEMQMVVDGLSAAGVVVGNLLRFRRVMLEVFEHERGSLSVPVAEVTVKTLEVRGAAGEGGGAVPHDGQGPEVAATGG